MCLTKVMLLHLIVVVVGDGIAFWFGNAMLASIPLGFVSEDGILQVAWAIQWNIIGLDDRLTIIVHRIILDSVREVVGLGEPELIGVRIVRIPFHHVEKLCVVPDGQRTALVSTGKEKVCLKMSTENENGEVLVWPSWTKA
jgi:hypothetical protein